MMAKLHPLETDEVIRLENASVCYRIPHERIGTFKEFAIRWVQRKVRYESFLALKDADLSISRGEIFGLIGRNGAGKSTLLKLVARVLPPSSGRVLVRGQVAPLLELGAGFHPDLTGRENIFLNGALLGFSHKQMEEKFASIVDFSELWEFIDAPLRTFSSGMVARLGFAVATDTQPDVFIVDEILGVGDEAFQKKCADRITSFCEHGTTILLVSHAMGTILDMCTRAAHLERGVIQYIGDVKSAVESYRAGQE